MRNGPGQNTKRGMALVAAIGLLVIFAALGTAYIGYMALEFDEAGVRLHEVRARKLAEAGVYAAIGEAQAAIARGEAPKPEYPIALAAYRQEATGQGVYPQTVHVRVSDESARVNLNYAPAALLRALGLPENAAKAIEDYRASGKSLASLDALRSEGLVNAATMQSLPRDLLTVYTGSDPRQPHSYLNLNSAPDPVLAAIFGISVEEAAALAAKRPFTSWEDAIQKVAREPSTFNVPAPQYASRDMPGTLALSSRCFRMTSLVEMDMPGGTGRPVHAGVEAVVALLEDGTYAIRYWREIHSGAAKAANETTTAPSAAAEETGK